MPGKDLSLARFSVSALRAAFFAVIAMLAVTQLAAQSTSTYSEYAAKFLCGVPTSSILAKGGIENAEYSTSINIHNPNLFTSDKPISFLKKAVYAHVEGNTFTPPSAFREDSLPNDYAETCHLQRDPGVAGRSGSSRSGLYRRVCGDRSTSSQQPKRTRCGWCLHQLQ